MVDHRGLEFHRATGKLACFGAHWVGIDQKTRQQGIRPCKLGTNIDRLTQPVSNVVSRPRATRLDHQPGGEIVRQKPVRPEIDRLPKRGYCLIGIATLGMHQPDRLARPRTLSPHYS